MTTSAATTEGVGAHRDAPWEWGLVIALSLVPALPLLLGSGLVNTRAGGDSPFLLVRVQQLVVNLRAGIFPVRWMPDGAYGLGYSFFNFYASLPYYLAALFRLAGLGYIGAIKLTQALGFIFAGLATYGFSRELGHRRAVSLFVSLVYSCAPFHMVNIYVRGDSLSEFYAFVFYPLILWSLLRMQKQTVTETRSLGENRFLGALFAVAVSYAGLMLTHNLSALIFTPFVLLYALVLGARAKARQRLQSWFTSAVALGVGALLSAWFWLPLLAERGNVSLKDMTTGYFNYALHFRGVDLVQRALSFSYAITADQNPFRMGLIQAMLALAGLIVLVWWWIRSRHVDPNTAFWAFLLAASTFMITPLSRTLWDHVPLLPLVQFPWRFLSIQAFAASLLSAHLIPQRTRRGWAAAFVLGCLALASALAGLHPERLLIHEDDITTQRLMWYEYFTANVGTTIRHDWLPRWVDPRPYTSEALWQGGGKPAPLVLEGEMASADLTALDPTFERWAIEVTSPQSLLAFHTYYYPGWQAHVDGQPATVEVLPGLGYIGLRLQEGQHEVQLQLGHTRVRLVAEVLSLLAAIALVLITVQRLRFHRHTWRILAAILLLVAPLAVVTLFASHPTRTTRLIAANPPGKLDLTMDFDRSPYLHHNPDGIRFADAARFTGYELSSTAIQAGETLTVTAYWDNVRRYGLLTKVALVSPAQHLFAVPLVIANSERRLTVDQHQHSLTIPATTPRGIYLLSVQVFDPQGEIRPVNARGETLGTTYLLPVHISGGMQARGDEPVLERFGERIAFSEAQTIQDMPGTLEVMLTWRVLASPPQNYKIALRLKDPVGWEVARLDTQPGYGFYPTSMWRPGELVHDRYILSLDDGTPPGAQYSLDVTLYDSASLRPIGTVSIPDVAVTQPTVRQDYSVLHQLGPGMALVDAQLPATEVESGAELVFLLKWAATARVDGDYACRITLLDDAGKTAKEQTLPLTSQYATSAWPQNAVIAGRYALPLSPDFPAGQYRAAVTLIETASGSEAGSFILPTPVRVSEPVRNFTVPRMQQTVGADFGGQVRLLGYDLQRTEQDLHLVLHWQALSPMSTDYKLFVHLFDPQTENIVAQQDVLAGGDAHPTTSWVTQEVVSSSIALPLENVPPSDYRLAIGLYHPAGRLPVTAPSEFAVSSDRLLLNESIRP